MGIRARIALVGAIILSLVAAPAGSAENYKLNFFDGVGSFSSLSNELNFQIVEPDDNTTFLGAAGYLAPVNNGEPDWSGQIEGYSNESGQISISIPADGDWFLEAQVDTPEIYYSPNRFAVTVSGGSVTKVAIWGQPSDEFSPSGGLYSLPITKANFYFAVNGSDGQPFIPDYENDKMPEGQLYKLNGSAWDNVSWLDHYRTWGANGFTGSGILATIKEAGTYRIRVVPRGDATSGPTFTDPFEVVGDEVDPVALPTLTLEAPQMLAQVVLPGSTDPIPNASLRLVLEDGVDDFGVSGVLNVAAISFPGPGTYSLETFPPQDGYGDYARKAYTVVVADDLTVSVVGVEPVDGIYQLEISSANLILQPAAPDGVGDQDLTWANASILQWLNGQQGDWVGNNFLQSGSISFNVDDGEYLIELWPGERADYRVAKANYRLSVSNGGQSISITDMTGSQEFFPTGDGSFVLPVGKANFLGRAVNASNEPVVTSWQNRAWVSVDLFIECGGDCWNYVGNTNVDAQGYFSFVLSEVGTYKYVLRPSGYPDYAGTFATVTLSEGHDFSAVEDIGNVTLPAPDVKLAVRTPDGTTNLLQANIDILDSEGRYVDNVFTGQTGIASLSFPSDGEFELRVSPPRTAAGSAKKSYTAVVSAGGDSVVISGSEAGSSGESILRLGVPTLVGTVKDPSGTNPSKYSEVVPVSALTGQDLWEYSATTDSQGRWAMALPEGTYYIFARAPWGSAEFGSGNRVGPIEVDANGTVTSIPSGYIANQVNLRLRLPTWSGIVVNPTNTQEVMTNVQVCLVLGQSDQTWNCAQTNNLGEWSIAAPADFVGFDEYSQLMISEWGDRLFAEKRVSGAADIEAILGAYVADGNYSDIELSPALPNLKIEVTAGGNPAQRVWVGVDDGREWLGGGETNAQGIASISVPEDKLSTSLKVQVNIEHNNAYSSDYASTRVDEVPVVSDGVGLISISLLEPNLLLRVTSPDGTQAIEQSWVEALDVSSRQWVGGTNTSAAGRTTMFLGEGSYTLTVNPPWDGNGVMSKSSYSVEVNSDNQVTSVRKGLDEVAPSSDGSYDLALTAPNVVGIVKNSAGSAVRDSWVNPIDIAGFEYFWWLGTNSRLGGNFAMNLPEGEYLLEANAPWINPLGDARSSRCGVNIDSNGDIITETSSCVDSDNQIVLNLRAPNLTFTLTDGAAAVPYANVGFFLGQWSFWTQSNSQGKVSVLIDGAEIAERNPDMSGVQDIRVRVEAPYGSTDVVGWECNTGDSKPICDALDDFDFSAQSDYLATDAELGEIQLLEPNTKVRVQDGNGDPVLAAGSWVVLYREHSGWREWIAGSNTDSQGYAAFNVEETSGTFAIEVNAPFELRDQFAQNIYTGLSLAEVNGYGFNLAVPNLKVEIRQSDGQKPSKWSWIGIEDWSGGAFVDWVGGYGADEFGKVSLSLPSSKTLKLRVNPGPGSAGTQISCNITTNISGEVTAARGPDCVDFVSFTGGILVLQLSQGNVRGTVTYGVSPTSLAGVLIQATADGRESQTTTSKSDGSWSFSLEPGVLWTIKAFYVSRPGLPTFSSNTVQTTIEAPASYSGTAVDLVLE